MTRCEADHKDGRVCGSSMRLDGTCPREYDHAPVSEWTMTVEDRVHLAKLEIRKDVRDGAVPSTVRSFADLHDYVDANEYGALFHLPMDTDAERDGSADIANEVQHRLDNWIKGGGLL